jgi:sugar lactone lactonase YvrE
VDSKGNVYVADSGDNVVRMVAAGTGIITTIAGTGVAGHTGDNGPAASAELWAPSALAVDAAGDLFIGETGDNVVRRINATTGTITTFAGNPTGTGSIGGPATSFNLYSINGLACDRLGDLYIAEYGDIVEVNAATQNISEIAGYSTNAGFGSLAGIAVDSGQNIYVSDFAYSVVWKVVPSGTVTVFAGSRYGASGGDGGPATAAGLYYPAGLATDAAGNVYIADDFDFAIREVNTSGIINTVAGILHDPYSIGSDGSPATNVGLYYPGAIAADAAGDVYLADQDWYRVREITAPTVPPSSAAAAPVFSLTSGTYPGSQTLTMTEATPGAEIYVSLNGTAPTTASQGYHGPIDVTGSVTVQAIALAPGYLASAPVSATYTITTPPAALIATVAGNGQPGFSGDNGPAINASLGQPEAIAFDGTGDLYIADASNNVVWMVAANTGNITVVAGTGTAGVSGDGGPATAAELNIPEGVAVDKAGNLYIADTYNGVIRRVTAQTGVITTIAGPGVYSTLGDGGPATSAYLGYPDGMALDSAGNLYIADGSNNRIRMIAATTGIISTVAGGGTTGQLGDGGPATAATLSYPEDVKLDSAGNLYISDSVNGRIRKVTASTGLITTIAGNGVSGDVGDGGPATAAEISVEEGIAVDAAGNVYLSNWLDTIRKVDAKTGIISTIAGDGYFGYGGDGGAATMAELYGPQGIALDSKGNLYFGDLDNSRVREVIFTTSAVAPTITLAPSASSITTAQALTVTIAVSGGSTSPTPTGSVTLSGGGYTSAPTTLSNGDATISIPAGSLAAGNDTLTVTYSPDIASAASYATATQSTTVTVAVPIGTATATVTATPSATIITNNQSVTVNIAVAGSSGQTTPTGTVTLASGTYSAQQTLSSGAASFDIAAGTLGSGTNTLTASYAGDATYATAMGTTIVTVSPVTMAISTPSPVSPGDSANATVTLTAGSNYSGTLNLKCTLTSSPNGAQSLPTCAFNPASVTIAAGGSGTTALTMNTTAASSSALARPLRQNLWGLGGGGAVLAVVLFFGVPSRRRRWLSMSVLLGLIVAAGAIGCGGSGSGGTSPINPTTPATTAGSYTFTVTGTDSANASITVSANVTLTVQ